LRTAKDPIAGKYERKREVKYCYTATSTAVATTATTTTTSNNSSKMEAANFEE
jgi:hypothetical protein